VMWSSVWDTVDVRAAFGLEGSYVQQQASGLEFVSCDTWKENVRDTLPSDAAQPRHSNWDCFALSSAACTNIGCPLMLVTDSMLPSGRTDTITFTSPPIKACRARGG
jgi:hypothetical protein